MIERQRGGQVVDKIHRVKYRCSNRKCGAEDHVKLYGNESAPPCINCWQCRAGLQMAPEQMMQQGIGMFMCPPEEQPVDDESTPRPVSVN
jgi:hypothetical protein